SHTERQDALEGRYMAGQFHFDFGDPQRQWLFNMRGYSGANGTDQMNIGGFKKHVAELTEIYTEVARPSWDGRDLNLPSTELNSWPDAQCAPGMRSLACVPAHAAGYYGYNLTNLATPLDDDAMPRRTDTDLQLLLDQMSTYFAAVADAPGISLNYRNKRSVMDQNLTFSLGAFGSPIGTLAQLYAKGSTDIVGPAMGGIMISGAGREVEYMAGHMSHGFAGVNALGMVFDPNLSKDKTKKDTKAVIFDQYGDIVYRSQANKGTKVYLRYGHGGMFSAPFMPNEYDNPGGGFQFLTAASDAKFNPESDYGGLSTDEGWVHMGMDESRWKLAGDHGLLLLGSVEERRDLREEEPELFHDGLSNDAQDMIRLDSIRQSSHDYSLLNEERLGVLRSKNIINDAAETLNAMADEYRAEAAELRATGQWSDADAKEIFALAHDHRAYEPTRAVANDMVQAVVILLLLSIPFAFSMERLVLGATSVYKQIFGFLAIFLTTFLILYLLHPAFSLAAAPIVIFLAFVIIIMSALVIYVVMSRFKMEIMALQGLGSKSHSEESTSGTALASVFIGISGMRNRPLKTFLTASTVVLLTFTILVFASFNSSVGVVDGYLGQGTGPDRVEVHRASHLPIPERLLNSIESEFGEDYHIHPRAALFRDPLVSDTFQITIALYAPRTGAVTSIKAVLGLDPAEATRNPELTPIIPPTGATQPASDRPIWLPGFVADHMRVRPGDEIVVQGISFTYQGSFDEGVLQGQTYMSSGRLVPPDFEAIFRQMELKSGSGSADEIEKIDTSSFQWSPASEIAVVDVADMSVFERSKPLVNALVLYPRGGQDPYETAAGISRVFHDPVYAKSAEGGRSFFFTEAFQGSGFGEVIVPLLLGGLIIFSSLLGSIVDREREIFTFSALGLSPPSVAALFFAESSVYAVIGGVGGYLVSQIVAAFLNFLASYGLFHPPEMNFSSLSSTYTILVVMATVILSTIYPALKAGKSANPGVARKWKMPTPTADNTMEFLFPFTVSSTDMVGVLSFIHEHFDNHRDASLGSFAAISVEVKRLPDDPAIGADNYAIEAEVSLAPFDLGIFQSFRMSSRDSDIEGIKEVLVQLELHSGSPSAWVRSNRAFIADLRKQFLLWRNLPPETVEHYCSMTQHEALFTKTVPAVSTADRSQDEPPAQGDRSDRADHPQA
ncbi:MAG: ABC transporter permease, partial [Planctomycetota bacterium]